MSERVGDWIQTYTGKKFWPFDPRPEEVDILDIAHALSNLCRFGGHTRKFYSVAQHSVLMSKWIPEELKLYALLHDAPEAYLIDLPTPIKRDPMFACYRTLESSIACAVFAKFNLKLDEKDLVLVKYWDRVLCATERRDLFKAPLPWAYLVGVEPHLEEIEPWTAERSEEAFLYVYENCVHG